MKLKKSYGILLAVFLLMASCGGKTAKENSSRSVAEAYQKVSPDFNADSAYYFVDRQVAFGTRVPNSPTHVACGDYLVGELKRFGWDVTEQRADLKAFDGTVLKARNIIGSFLPGKTDRILLFAHWDTRPFADQDPDPANYNKPIPGANDGASGVGVLLEIARIMQQKAPAVGVDIIFFDAEDYGEPSFVSYTTGENTWCLGSQYWAKNPHIQDYKARYGILLDMVGAQGAVFQKEYFSRRYANDVLVKVWNTAQLLGYGSYFENKNGGAITDDHLPVNQDRRIPSIDIIHYEEGSAKGFGWYWHTMKDDMRSISKETLKAVGQTVLEVVYMEK